MTQPLTITNADVWNGTRFERRDLYMTDVILDKPDRNAITVDLSGYTIFPGMINAHDHLELNHYPRTKFRERYDNAHQWGEDVNKHLDEEPFKTLRSYPLEDRCFIGGLKNLLCGALTVVHHNPPHKYLFRRDFPVRVLKRYGWTHSLHFNTDEEVVASYKRTPPNAPWFIHLAEGTDEIAAGEYQRLKKLGCVGSNTVIIHGVGMTDEDIADAAPIVRGLIWCPSTNYELLGKSANIQLWQQGGGRLLLGSDSRLTAYGSLLDEMLFADYVGGAANIYQLVSGNASTALGLLDRGHLNPGAKADFIAFRPSDLDFPFPTDVQDLSIVVLNGVPQFGTVEVMSQFTSLRLVDACYADVFPLLFNTGLARQIARCSLKEPGLELLEHPTSRRFPF